MNDIFQIANIGLIDGQQRLDAISSNAASAALPGFRRHIVTGRPFEASLAATDAMTMNRTPPQRVDLHAGASVATGRALDVAIDGDDLFFALTDGAQTWLTRSGAFQLNAEGLLTGERGLRVVGAQGDVVLPAGDVTVEADGRVTRDGVVVGQLLLFRVDEPRSLVAAHGSLLTTTDAMEPAQMGTWRVRGGTLEASNTDVTREMLGMMTLTRQFESLSRIVKSYDDALSHVIQKLGES